MSDDSQLEQRDYLTPEMIASWPGYSPAAAADDPRQPLRQRLRAAGEYGPGQIAGRRWPIGCVSLEVTQRCNLDCTLCYLSEHAEAVPDIPLDELFRRIDMIHQHYGADADIQISGGDPTLRPLDDLVRIVERIRGLGMRCSLFTNGILASRDMLTTLCRAGLNDVAFHVDMTQQRKGYQSETELHALRLEYLNRARGLPLAVFFNTTIFAGNYADIPEIVRFFCQHADVVSLVSFQLQADTGRGVLRERAGHITQAGVIASVQKGAGTALRFDSLYAGHPSCNRYAMGFEINGRLYDFYDDPKLSAELLDATSSVAFPRGRPIRAAANALRAFAVRPRLWQGGLGWLVRTLWRARRDLWAARGRIRKLSIVLHNFMDASRLEAERLNCCVFMVATAEGPMSMCLHNAKRDQLLRPSAGPDVDPVAVYPLKFLKGRSRRRAMDGRAVGRTVPAGGAGEA